MPFFSNRQALADATARIAALEAENRSYTDIVTQGLLEAATDTVASAYTGALEIAASQLSRAFSVATVSGSDAAMLNAWQLAQIGRSLVEDGESIWVRRGRRLLRAEQYGINPNGTYEITLPDGPSLMQSSRVLHVRWNIDISSRRGIAPLTNARTLRTLLQRLETSATDEMNAAVGYLLPLPADGSDTAVAQLKQDLGNLKGKIAIVETTRGGWGEGPQGSPRRDFELARMGPDIPDGNVMLFREARDGVLAACGYPVQLAQPGGDGTGQREAWRRYLHGTVAPMGILVGTAAAEIGLNIELDFQGLFASDIQGRARAFQSLVGGGMDITEAAAASGILNTE